MAALARGRLAAAHRAPGRERLAERHDWCGLAAGRGAGRRIAQRPRADIVKRAARRTSGSARQRP